MIKEGPQVADPENATGEDVASKIESQESGLNTDQIDNAINGYTHELAGEKTPEEIAEIEKEALQHIENFFESDEIYEKGSLLDGDKKKSVKEYFIDLVNTEVLKARQLFEENQKKADVSSEVEEVVSKKKKPKKKKVKEIDSVEPITPTVSDEEKMLKTGELAETPTNSVDEKPKNTESKPMDGGMLEALANAKEEKERGVPSSKKVKKPATNVVKDNDLAETGNEKTPGITDKKESIISKKIDDIKREAEEEKAKIKDKDKNKETKEVKNIITIEDMEAFYDEAMNIISSAENQSQLDDVYKKAETLLAGKLVKDGNDIFSKERSSHEFSNLLITLDEEIQLAKNKLAEKNKQKGGESKDKKDGTKENKKEDYVFISEEDAKKYIAEGGTTFNKVDSFLHRLEDLAQSKNLNEDKLEVEVKRIQKQYDIKHEVLSIPEPSIIRMRDGRYRETTHEEWVKMVNRFTDVQEKFHKVWSEINPGVDALPIVEVKVGDKKDDKKDDADKNTEDKKSRKDLPKKIMSDMTDDDNSYLPTSKGPRSSLRASDYLAEKAKGANATSENTAKGLPKTESAPAQKPLTKVKAVEMFGSSNLPEREFTTVENALNNPDFLQFLTTVDKNSRRFYETAGEIENGNEDDIREKYELFVKAKYACADTIDVLKNEISRAYGKDVVITPEIEGYIRDHYAQIAFESPDEIADIYATLEEHKKLPTEIALEEAELQKLTEKYGGKDGLNKANEEIDIKDKHIKGLKDESDRLTKILGKHLDPKHGNDVLYTKIKEGSYETEEESVFNLNHKYPSGKYKPNPLKSYIYRSKAAAELIGSGAIPGGHFSHIFSPAKKIEEHLENLKKEIESLDSENLNRMVEINQAQSRMERSEYLAKEYKKALEIGRRQILEEFLPYQEVNKMVSESVLKNIEKSIEPDINLEKLELEQQKIDRLRSGSESSVLETTKIETSPLQEKIDIAFKKRVEREIQEEIEKANEDKKNKNPFSRMEDIIRKKIYGKDRKSRRFGSKEGEEAREVIISAIEANIKRGSISQSSKILLSRILVNLKKVGIAPPLPPTTKE